MSNNPNAGQIPVGFKYIPGSEKPAVDATNRLIETYRQLRDSSTASAAASNAAFKYQIENIKDLDKTLKEVNKSQSDLYRAEIANRQSAAQKTAETEAQKQQAIKQTLEYQRNEAAAEKALASQQSAAVRQSEELKRQAIKQTLDYQKDAAAAEKILADQAKEEELQRLSDIDQAQINLLNAAVDRRKQLADVEAEQTQSQLFDKELPPGQEDSGGSSGSGLSGRGFGALGRLATRLGAPEGVSQGLFVTGESLAGARGLSRLPVIGGVAEEGAGLATALGEKLAPALGLAGAQVPALVTSIAGLAAVVAPAAAAAALIAAGVEHYNNVIKEGNTALTAASTGLAEYYKAIVTGTTDSVNKQLEAAKVQKDLVDAELKQRQDAAGNAFVSAQQSGDALARFEFLLANLSTGFKDNQDRTDALQKSSVALGAQITGLNQATQNASVIERQLAEDRQKAADKSLSLLDQETQQKIKLAEIGQNTNEQSLRSEIEKDRLLQSSYQKELDILNSREDQGITSPAQKQRIQELGQSIQFLDEQTKAANTQLTNVVIPQQNYNDGLAVQTKGLEAGAKAINDYNAARAKEIGAESKLTDDYNAKTADITVQRQTRDNQQLADYESSRSYKIEDFHTKQANSDADFYDGQADKYKKLYASADQALSKAQATALKDQSDYNQKQADNARKLADEINKIINDSREKELDAASRLDARAIAQTEREAAKQIQEKTATYNSQKEIDDRNEAQKLADIKDTAQKEHDQKLAQGVQDLQDAETQYLTKRQRDQKAFNEEVRRNDEAETIKINRQRAADAEADRLRLESYNRQLTSLQTDLLDKQEALSANSWARIVQDAKDGFDKLALEAHLAFLNFQGSIGMSGAGAQYGSNSYGGYRTPDQYTAPAAPTGGITNSVPGFSIGSPLKTIGNLFSGLGFADGGIAPANKFVRLSENEPELVGGPALALFRKPTPILSGAGTSALLKGGGGKQITVNGGIHINGTGLNEAQLSRAVESAMIKVIESEAA